jgi:hypothetical protein
MTRRDDGKAEITWAERVANDDVPTTFNDSRAGGLGHYVPEPTLALKKNWK